MYSEKELYNLIGLARTHNLENIEILEKYSLYQLRFIFNGIGSESMPTWMRKVVSTLHPSLEPVALIHDVEWSETDGNKDTFTASNSRFKRNAMKIAFGLFKWYNPRRYIVWRQGVRFGNVCQLFGWRAFLAGYRNADVEPSAIGE